MNNELIACYQVTEETRLMLRLALRERLPQAPEGIDWDTFRETMDKHRIYPLVIRGLRQQDPGILKACPVLEKYRDRQGYYTMESFKRIRTLAEIAAAFDKEGIRMLSMKGPLLSMDLYGDPSMRHSRDLDLLVSEADYFGACQCLLGLGFERQENVHETTYLRSRLSLLYSDDKHTEFSRDGLSVELHWRGSIWYDLNVDQLWDRRETKLLMGTPVHQMGAMDEWPYLISHAAVHGYMRLRWLLDLYELQKDPRFRWEQMYEIMASRGHGAVLLETLLVLFRLEVLPMEPVETELFSLRREGDGVRFAYAEELRRDAQDAIRFAQMVMPLMLVEKDMGSELWYDYRRQLPMEEEKTPLWVKLVNIFRPEEVDYALIDLPDRWFWLYFLIRPVYWVWRKLTGGKK